MSRWGQAEEALRPYRPGVDGPFGPPQAGHLLRRTSFGGTLAERDQVLAWGLPNAVIELTTSSEPSGNFAAALAALAPVAVSDLETAQAVWLLRMLRDPRPFGELLALLWHGHFATSIEKVGRLPLMLQQIETLRRLGRGPFGELVRALARDPALIVWLDGNTNRRHHANENFARELLELFTLGEGHFDERDVLEAARAFSGWHELAGRFRFVADEHDDGPKQVLARQGALDGDDVIAACLEEPACARHLAHRFLVSFVRPDPGPELLDVVAARYLDSGYDTLDLVRALCSSRLFFEPGTRRSLVRSPVALAVGAARDLGLRVDAMDLARRLAALGQRLLAPPSVKGWDGGRSWLNTATLIGRIHLAAVFAEAADIDALAPEAETAVDALLDRLLEGEAPPQLVATLLDVVDTDGDRRGALQLVLASPEYQLA